MWRTEMVVSQNEEELLFESLRLELRRGSLILAKMRIPIRRCDMLSWPSGTEPRATKRQSSSAIAGVPNGERTATLG